MDNIKIGIIGCGGITDAHVNAYKRYIEAYGGLEIVALCDLIPGKAQAFAKEMDIHNVRFYEDYIERRYR